jgi:hypothetical protein
MYSEKEKYDLIVKLLKEGRTNREICKIVRCSPNEITTIRKIINGENTDTGIDMKGKSICAQVFDLLEKDTSLSQIVIKVDIDPEEAMRLQDKYLHVSKRNKIIHLLKDKNDMALTIEIIEFLRVNPKYWKKIKEIEDLQIIIWNLMADREEVEEDIGVNKTLLRYYDEQIEKKEKQLGLPSKY